MNVTEIAQKIERPDLCTAQDINQLRELVNRFPYAQSFAILLLKTLSNSNDVAFEEALNQHAYRVSDRMNLYYLLNENVTFVSDDPLSPEISVNFIESQDGIAQTELPKLETVPETEIIAEKIIQTSLDEPKETIRLNYEELVEQKNVHFLKVEEMNFEPVVIAVIQNDAFISDVHPTEHKDSKPENAEADHTITHQESQEVEVDESSDLVSADNAKEESGIIENYEEGTSFISEEDKAELPISVDAEIHEVVSDSVHEEFDTLERMDANTPLSEDILEVNEDGNKVIEEILSSHVNKIESSDSYERTIKGNPEGKIEKTEPQELRFFDPTEDLFAPKNVDELVVLAPSTFEENKKPISLDLIEKKFDAVTDEFTSQAISRGFDLSTSFEKLDRDLQSQPIEIPKVEKPSSEIEHDETENVELPEATNFQEIFSKEKTTANSDELTVSQQPNRSFYSWLQASKNKEEKAEIDIHSGEKIKRSEELLEKFIREDPKISRFVKGETLELKTEIKKKVPFFKASEKAKESVQDNNTPISMTLAKIFEAQGNYPKAISSYEQLMLLYPEKKTFFANQIKELTKKLNN